MAMLWVNCAWGRVALCGVPLHFTGGHIAAPLPKCVCEREYDGHSCLKLVITSLNKIGALITEEEGRNDCCIGN